MDIIWSEIEKLRPRMIFDMACGTGQGIKHQIKRINWPVTIVMVDLSHRILKWNKMFFTNEWKNPYVELVYLACDGADLPVQSNSIDMVFSNAGYESMQTKMMNGFQEAFRVIKNDGHTIYTKSVVENHGSESSKKWISLLFSSLEKDEKSGWADKILDISQWLSVCKETGFVENSSTKIYDELPAPDTDKFPYENEMAQWITLQNNLAK